MKSIKRSQLFLLAALSLLGGRRSEGAPQVSGVQILSHHSDNTVWVGDYIRLTVSEPNAITLAPGERICLYLDGQPVNSFPIDPTAAADQYVFALDRDTSHASIWQVYYAYPRSEARIIGVSVGPEHHGPLPSSARIRLLIYRATEKTIAFILIGLLIALLLWAAVKTTILRDKESQLADKGKLKATFSLSRTQLAFWTVVVIASYIMIYAQTGEVPDLSESTLILLGISVVGTVGARLVDPDKMLLDQQDSSTAFESEGFLKDILSDSGGPNIHRFQFVAWTVVMGYVFLRSVVVNLSMPEFSANQLLLMGISTGAYVTLKGADAKKEASNAAADADATEGSEDADLIPANGAVG